MRRLSRTPHLISSGATLILATLGGVTGAQGQSSSGTATVTSTTTLAAELRQVLPADVAARILARVDAAEAAGLPGNELEQRALKFAARGVAAAAIEQSVEAHAERMARAKQALERPHAHHPTGDEIAAGAEAMREGADGRLISALAKSAPSGRSLEVPLYVIGSLAARGLPADQALARVETMLRAHASDENLESLLGTTVDGHGDHGGDHKGGLGGGEHQGGKGVGIGVGVGVDAGGAVGAGTSGPPVGVPGNGGGTVRPPTVPHPHH